MNNERRREMDRKRLVQIAMDATTQLAQARETLRELRSEFDRTAVSE